MVDFVDMLFDFFVIFVCVYGVGCVWVVGVSLLFCRRLP